jgi:tetratricopeptide (TPR) repeat protein
VREGDDALALTVALRAAVRAGRADDAVEHARALAQNEPCDAIAVEALCLASDMVAARDPGRAAALLELAAARRPRDARLALRLIEALACIPGSTGLAATIEAALGACEPGVERAELARDAAIVCELADRHDDAARLFHLAAMSLPADARVLEGLARAEARAGRNDSALGFWDRAADVLASDGEARAAARALDGAARAASALGRPDVVEERLTRATELAPHDPERWAALVRARRAIGAARPAARAEDRLLESVERAAAGAVSDLVADELAAAARAALDGGENARANSFIEALMHARGEEDARVAALRDALSRLERTIAPSTSVESLLSPSPLVERARRAALARDTAELRAALNAAERAGDLDAARSIVALALEVVGDGPARRALEETRRRLFG